MWNHVAEPIGRIPLGRVSDAERDYRRVPEEHGAAAGEEGGGNRAWAAREGSSAPYAAPNATPVARPSNGPSPAIRLSRGAPAPGTSTGDLSASFSTVSTGVVLAGRPLRTMSRYVVTLNAVVPAAPAAAPVRICRSMSASYPCHSEHKRTAGSRRTSSDTWRQTSCVSPVQHLSSDTWRQTTCVSPVQHPSSDTWRETSASARFSVRLPTCDGKRHSHHGDLDKLDQRGWSSSISDVVTLDVLGGVGPQDARWIVRSRRLTVEKAAGGRRSRGRRGDTRPARCHLRASTA